MDGALRGVAETIRLAIIVAGISAGLVPLLLSYIAWQHFFGPDWRQEAIDRGFAIYCPDSGDFAWAGECEADND